MLKHPIVIAALTMIVSCYEDCADPPAKPPAPPPFYDPLDEQRANVCIVYHDERCDRTPFP